MGLTSKINQLLNRNRQSECHNYSKSYAQEGEDLILAQLIGDIHTTPGFYADVGAHHPINFSNTHLFYEAGWAGINIDANTDIRSEFLRLRPRDVFVNAAVHSGNEPLQLYEYSHPALNTVCEHRVAELAQQNIYSLRVRQLRGSGLTEILSPYQKMFKKPCFLNIDVEGNELAVIASLDSTRFPFDYILVEQRLEDLTALSNTEVFAELVSRQYVATASTQRTVIYRHKETHQT